MSIIMLELKHKSAANLSFVNFCAQTEAAQFGTKRELHKINIMIHISIPFYFNYLKYSDELWILKI